MKEHKSPPRDIRQVRRNCEDHERLLKDLVRGRYGPSKNYAIGGLRFVVARRWSSWYPSYFDVEGGCYALIPGDVDFTRRENLEDERIGVVVIDPGFRFIEILRREYHIEPQDISTVIVTHFHPDHMAGLIEFSTIKRTSKLPCSVYLNSTMYRSFKGLEDPFITISELSEGQIQEIMRYKARDGQYVGVSVKAVGVHHSELGNQHASLGLRLKISLSGSEDLRLETRKTFHIGILGDTDGNTEYIRHYVRSFEDVDLLAVHLGTFNDRKLGRGGKHLYITGVREVLKGIGDALARSGFIRKLEKHQAQKKIVVLSEFGLELADDGELYRQLGTFVRSYSWRLPLLFTENYLRERSGDSEESKSYDLLLSRFLASATIDTLGRAKRDFAIPSPGCPPSSQLETRKILIALALQVISITGARVKDGIDSLVTNMGKLTQEKRAAQAGIGPAYSAYVDLVEKEISKRKVMESLKQLYSSLLQNAVFSQLIKDKDYLVSCCNALIGEAAENFENPGRIVLHLASIREILSYVSTREELSAIGEDKCSWVYEDLQDVVALRRFWVACLIGLCCLLQAVRTSDVKDTLGKACGQNLLDIGTYFRKDITNWGNLLVGDIGCTVGIYPFGLPDNEERLEGIWLKSHEGKWIHPYTAVSFYSSEARQVSYCAAET